MTKHLLPASCLLVIAVITSLLYVPFLSNALVFDDHVLFTSLSVYRHAEVPFDFRPRTFPYFTLGFVQVMFDSIEVHRIVSLVLHILCAGVLFTLLMALLRQALSVSNSGFLSQEETYKHATVLASIGAAWFAIHPVAVYGAGYLVQRTILFATLFSLLSLFFYCRAFTHNRTSDVVTAALFYSAAVFSKEHAVMLPLAAITLTALYVHDGRLNVKLAGLYLVLCIPAGAAAVIASKYAVASSYEPYFAAVSSQIHEVALLNTSGGQWFVSAIMQSNFFFDYFRYWIAPDVQSMSIDMRVDFTHLWKSWWLIPKAALFAALPVAGLWLLTRGRVMALIGFGFLYSWLLYLTELSTVRFQEPFVLYRSYLWAPGFIVIIVSAFCSLRRRWIIAGTIPIFVVYFGLAHGRLQSLVSQDSIWKDAAEKLESKAIPGSDRIFFNRGLQYMKAKKFNEAITDFSYAIKQNSSGYYFYYQRGVAYFSLQKFANAQADFDQAYKLNNKHGPTHYALGMMFERRGCFTEAKRAYSASMNLGTAIAQLRLDALTKSGELKTEKNQGKCHLNQKVMEELNTTSS